MMRRLIIDHPVNVRSTVIQRPVSNMQLNTATVGPGAVSDGF
jgi:hypothetical protein